MGFFSRLRGVRGADFYAKLEERQWLKNAERNMRLDRQKNGERKPLRTVTEIAEILGVTAQRLVRDLRQDPEAPREKMRGNTHGHYNIGRHRVWYDPEEVVRWHRQTRAR